MDIGVILHGADGMAGVPEALPLQPGQYLKYPFIPCFLHLPGSFIGNDGDSLRICAVFPQFFKLLRHPRHMETDQHLDQLHPHFHVCLFSAGLFEIRFLFSRQGFKFIETFNNLGFFLRIIRLLV